jgi:hypothetical protein
VSKPRRGCSFVAFGEELIIRMSQSGGSGSWMIVYPGSGTSMWGTVGDGKELVQQEVNRIVMCVLVDRDISIWGKHDNNTNEGG